MSENDISFSCGREIFGDKLHLQKNFEKVKYIDQNSGQKFELSSSNETAGEFFQALYNAKAVTSPNFSEYKLFEFSSSDGTSVSIRLYEGGFASYRNCFVKFNNISAFNLLYASK